MCGFEGMYYKPQQLNREINCYLKCASGSVVEYRLAKARVAGSNPVSCSQGDRKKSHPMDGSFFYVQAQPGSNGSKSRLRSVHRRRYHVRSKIICFFRKNKQLLIFVL